MHLFERLRQGFSSNNSGPTTASVESPPEWTPAPEISHQFGLVNEATEDEYTAAEEFCARNPVDPPRLLPSDVIDRINSEASAAWTFDGPASQRFVGHIERVTTGTQTVIRIETRRECASVCLLSNLPIMAALCDIQGKHGVYYEVTVKRMDGIVAIGDFDLIFFSCLLRDSNRTYRNCMSSISLLEVSWMEQAECGTSSR
jgi:Ran-binding protein 9/10